MHVRYDSFLYLMLLSRVINLETVETGTGFPLKSWECWKGLSGVQGQIGALMAVLLLQGRWKILKPENALTVKLDVKHALQVGMHSTGIPFKSDLV